MDETTSIYTKKEFEAYFQEHFPNLRTKHYGDSRGYNKYKECQNVIIFSRYGLTYAHKMLLELRG
ncbi:MAG: hypothetical protein GF317_23725 [Candidatus Lokiarchaeota archaeon]|nr:hypothetical protein [Candidatus Lokiarchaeota archaeon]MBD3202380.1 hypothetical protein [Candidatus Lokiarchaeota archaeon]